MSEQVEVLKTVARRLEEARIPYMISGSVAMNFYAQPRMTRDIDIVIELASQDARLGSKLFGSDFYVDDDEIREAIQQRGMFNIIHNALLVKVDFIVRKESNYRREEFGRRRAIPIQDIVVFVAAPEDLILSKLDWARDSRSSLQLGDVRNLIRSNPDLDWVYLDRWAKELGLSDMLIEARES